MFAKITGKKKVFQLIATKKLALLRECRFDWGKVLIYKMPAGISCKHTNIAVTIPKRVLKLASDRNKLKRRIKVYIWAELKQLGLNAKLFIVVKVKSGRISVARFKLLFNKICLEKLEI